MDDKSYMDFSALNEEPMCSILFAVKCHSEERFQSRRGRSAPKVLVERLREDAPEVARDWLLAAFSTPMEGESANAFRDSLATPPLSDDALLFAATAFWRAYLGQVDEVSRLVLAERKKRGFLYSSTISGRSYPPLPGAKRNRSVETYAIKSEPVSDGVLAKALLPSPPGTASPKRVKTTQSKPKSGRKVKSKRRKPRRMPSKPLEVLKSEPDSNTGAPEMLVDCDSLHCEEQSNSTQTSNLSPYVIPPSPLANSQSQSTSIVPPPAQAVIEGDSIKSLDGRIAEAHKPPTPDIPPVTQPSSDNQVIITPLPRPALPIHPPIWAASRQEVCESFHWFRSYQGGVYHSDGFVKGYLLSAYAASRDMFLHGGRLIISHGGGKWESQHSVKGQTETHLADDQLAQDKSVRSLIANYKQKRPLVIVIDDKYALFPWDLSLKGVTYAVLGFFFISHVWAEYQTAANARGRVVRYKFAFQWFEAQGSPWWIGPNSNLPFSQSDTTMRPDLGNVGPPGMSTNLLPPLAPPSLVVPKPEPYGVVIPISTNACSRCRLDFPQVYLEWMCLNPKCSCFWLNAKGETPQDCILTYSPGFLELAQEPTFPLRAEDLFPRQPSLCPKTSTTDYMSARGWHCTRCGRLSCRSKWEKWDCPQCANERRIEGRTRNASEFLGVKVNASFHDHFVAVGSGIRKEPMAIFTLPRGRGSYQVFHLPHQRGRVVHIRGCLPFGNLDADQIFQRYQEQAATGSLPFRRWPLRAHKLRGQMLTHYFSQNAGIPYQYVGGAANTMPLDKAPVVASARDLIVSRLRDALGMNAQFNEVLSCAYMPKQKMAFHSDAEAGLGPVVAGLSLGSPALMHFRPRAKYEEIPDKRKVVISFILRHGDVLVMDGSAIQQYYEHTVVPAGFRIAATARMIYPENAFDSSVSRRIKPECCSSDLPALSTEALPRPKATSS